MPDAKLKLTTFVAARGVSIQRDTDEIRLANLAARVAAAGRRVLAKGSFDEQRDRQVLRSARQLLEVGAATLSDDVVPIYSEIVQQDSYTLARLTNRA